MTERSVKPVLETKILIPPINTPFLDSQGRISNAWYEFLSRLAAQLEALRTKE